MGLDVALVDLRLQDFLCAICLEFPVKPLECKKCKQLFCLTCLETWKQQHPDICPLRCPRPRFSSISESFDRILSSVRVKCKYHVLGCTETRVCSEIQRHEAECPLQAGESMELDESPSLKVSASLSIEEQRFKEAYSRRERRRPIPIEIPSEEFPHCAFPTPQLLMPYLEWPQLPAGLMFPPTPVYVPIRYAQQATFARMQF